MTHKRKFASELTLPTTTTAAGWLLMDRLHAPAWGYGVFWTLIGLVWLVIIVAMLIHIFSADEPFLTAEEIDSRLKRLERKP